MQTAKGFARLEMGYRVIRVQKRLFDFSVRVTIKRPQDPGADAAIPLAPPANAGSAPAATKP